MHTITSLSEEHAQFVINELILDENSEVRIAAISKMARKKMPGWDSVLAASLKDPNTNIQKTAVQQLIRNNDAQATMILNQYMNDYPEAPLSAYIRNVTKKRTRQRL